MERNVGLIVMLVFVSLLLILFCASFTASLAQLKGRSRKWGIVGLLLGIIGLIIVCFLPSKRDDNTQTNPIKYLFSRLPSMSKKTIGLIFGILAAVVLTAVLYDVIPMIIQNYKYEKQITKENVNVLQPKLINVNVTEVFASGESSYITTEDGKLYCFGRQIPESAEADTGIIYQNAKKVLSTDKICFILDGDGKLFGMGDNEFLQLPTDQESVSEFIQIAENVVDFSVSETTVGIIKTDNKLYMYGNNAHGQLGTYNTENKSEPVAVLGNVTQVVCEATFTAALQSTGDVVVFGSNADGQAAKAEPEFYAPTAVYKNIQKIAAGDGFILLLDNAGNVLSCGNNDCGQLGNGTTDKGAAFTQIMTGVTDIAAAKKSAAALSAAGELYTWGQNTVGQLGTGNEINQTLPVKAAEDVKSFSLSGLHTVILTNKGKVLSTGFNNCAQLGRGDSRSEFSALVTIKK